MNPVIRGPKFFDKLLLSPRAFPGLLLALFALAFAMSGRAETPTNPAPALSPTTNAEETVRTYLQLQEQLRALQSRLDQNRNDADRTAEKNVELLAARLQGIENSLVSQRGKELEIMQSSNRATLVAAATFAAIAFLALLVMAYFQWRTIGRLSEITTGMPTAHLLGQGSFGGEAINLPASGPVERSTLRLRGALQQLEKRIVDLEHSGGAGDERGGPRSEAASSSPKQPAQGNGDRGAIRQRVQVLVGRAQILLNLDKSADALQSLEEARALDPHSPDVLVKTGTALEKLDRVEEALAAYDEAIAADPSLTVAYLCKGGLCNRVGRNSEALECYEKALQRQK